MKLRDRVADLEDQEKFHRLTEDVQPSVHAETMHGSSMVVVKFLDRRKTDEGEHSEAQDIERVGDGDLEHMN